MFPTRRDIALDDPVAEAVDDACLRWPGADLAWQVVEWGLAHDPQIGLALNESGTVRAFIYDGAKSIGQPDIQVIYEIEGDRIIVRKATFSEPKLGYAGRA